MEQLGFQYSGQLFGVQLLPGRNPGPLEVPPTGDEVVQRSLRLPYERTDVPRDADASRKQIEHVDPSSRKDLEELELHFEPFGIYERQRQGLGDSWPTTSRATSWQSPVRTSTRARSTDGMRCLRASTFLG
jgi:hypothetical protein